MDDAPPDWSTSQLEITCPLCGYNLRGLTESRCPECGFTFRWGELLDADRNRHPWLFEHGRGRNVRAVLATYFRSALPRRFWRQVTPAHAVSVARLVIYWAVAWTVVACVTLIPLGRAVMYVTQLTVEARAQFRPIPDQPGHYANPFAAPRTRYGPIVTARERDAIVGPVGSAAYFREIWLVQGQTFRSGWQYSPPAGIGMALVILPGWSWLSLGALLLFQASMRRAKIRWGHMLRVAVYSGDFSLLVVVVAGVLYGFTLRDPFGRLGYARGDDVLANWIPIWPFADRAKPTLFAIALCVVVATYRLSIACGRYLRFSHPLLTAVASQLVVVLLVMVVLVRMKQMF